MNKLVISRFVLVKFKERWCRNGLILASIQSSVTTVHMLGCKGPKRTAILIILLLSTVNCRPQLTRNEFVISNVRTKQVNNFWHRYFENLLMNNYSL